MLRNEYKRRMNRLDEEHSRNLAYRKALIRRYLADFEVKHSRSLLEKVDKIIPYPVELIFRVELRGDCGYKPVVYFVSPKIGDYTDELECLIEEVGSKHAEITFYAITDADEDHFIARGDTIDN